MSFERLLKESRIQKVEASVPDFEICRKDLESAKNSFESEDYEWASTIAYNAVLRAGMKLMAFYGYRPIGKEHHKNVFEFLREVKIDESLVNYFNKVRVRRNEFLYRDVASTSENEAEEIIKKAESFVSKIRTNVRENRTKIKDF